MEAFLKTGKLGKSRPEGGSTDADGNQTSSKKKSWPVPWVEK